MFKPEINYKKPMKKSESDLSQCFLPNFCGLRMVFVVVVIAQLFAFVVSLLGMQQAQGELWQTLGLDSLFIQWCALASCAVMCVLRGFIAHFSHRVVAAISYFTIVLVICLVSEVAYWYVFRGSGADTSHWQFVLRNAVIAIILTGPILRYFYVQHQWRANVRAEAESRLQALQSRIRPHFFFNSMNTIASLTRSDPARAEAAVEDLADLFRASMRDARQFHSMQQEWHLCERYLEIESLRLGERLKIDWQVDDIPGDAFVPPLLIQPLLENAIYHGIERCTEGGTIHIHGQMQDKQITVSISNPVANELSNKHGNQIAQQNIRDRLEALYGQRGKMHVDLNDHTYQVTVSWPYWNKLDEDTDH